MPKPFVDYVTDPRNGMVAYFEPEHDGAWIKSTKTARVEQ